MAIIEAISSKANLKTIINYVTQDKKTNANLITGKDCLAESSLEEMLYTKELYNKNNGRQYIHIIQSFDPKDNLTAEQVHNTGIRLAEKFNGYQVLVATHIDKEHLHSHLVVNSVSFENGYKIQMSKKNLQNLKDHSDKLCLQIGASVIPKKENTQYIKRNEYRVAEQGKSWKFKLINAIDLSIAESSCKEDFIKTMNKLGYQVNWTDTRKYITYTTPDGYKCRDNKLYEEKYLKGNIKNEFRTIKEKQSNNTRKSSSSISNQDELLPNRANSTARFIRIQYENEGRYFSNKIQNARNLFQNSKGKYPNERGTTSSYFRNYGKAISKYETETTKYRGRTETNNYKIKMENRNNSILNGLISISNIFSSPQINNKPKRKIRRYKTLSKQAMKEYAMKKLILVVLIGLTMKKKYKK